MEAPLPGPQDDVLRHQAESGDLLPRGEGGQQAAVHRVNVNRELSLRNEQNVNVRTAQRQQQSLNVRLRRTSWSTFL